MPSTQEQKVSAQCLATCSVFSFFLGQGTAFRCTTAERHGQEEQEKGYCYKRSHLLLHYCYIQDSSQSLL